jgi:hypothetical protein
LRDFAAAKYNIVNKAWVVSTLCGWNDSIPSVEKHRRELKEFAPLAVGFLLDAEWELMTIFAAVLGPAEAATWAVLGFVWNVFIWLCWGGSICCEISG